MITSVHDGAKAIIQYLLDEAVKSGNLQQSIAINDNDLTSKLDFKSSKLFAVCIQYLKEKGLVGSAKTKDAHHLTLTVAAVDFLES